MGLCHFYLIFEISRQKRQSPNFFSKIYVVKITSIFLTLSFLPWFFKKRQSPKFFKKRQSPKFSDGHSYCLDSILGHRKMKVGQAIRAFGKINLAYFVNCFSIKLVPTLVIFSAFLKKKYNNKIKCKLSKSRFKWTGLLSSFLLF